MTALPPVLIATQLNEFLDCAAQQCTQKVAFTADDAPSLKNEEMIDAGEVKAPQLPALIAHVRELAHMAEGGDKGMAILRRDNPAPLRNRGPQRPTGDFHSTGLTILV